MTQSLLGCLRDEAALRLEAGASAVDVQNELIEPASGLSEDERAALWLFAWAYRPAGGRQSGRRSGDMLGPVAG
jgi:hypothetical protein